MIALKDGDLFRQQALIGGNWRGASVKATVDVIDPASQEVLGTIPDMGREETAAAINAAADAFKHWKRKAHGERAALLERWYELMRRHEQDLALLLTLEQGKPLAESLGEIRYGASFVKWFAEEARRINGSTIPSPTVDRRILVLKEPVGVCGIITPWNFPNAMITRKVAPALAAGCTVVVKPAQLTPLSALALAELAQRAGLPKGIFNVVPSSQSARVGKELTENPLVRKFSFTGSTEVGKQLMRQCASTVKKISLELGGNAPFIVFDDADLDAAVTGALASKFRNMGQTCVCANRFLVQDGVYDAFTEKLSRAVGALKIGNGMVPGIEQGPLINMAAVEKVEELIADATKKGAKVALGGKRHALGGTFFEPTIVRDVTKDMAFAREEIFGPVVTLFRFKDDEEAIRMANDTEYGLAAYFYARDVGRIFRVMEGLEYGIVGVNEGIISTEVAPFGGMKESGMGREGSKYGIEDFVEIKYVALGGLGGI